MTTWRRRRSPLLAFFHAHRLLLSALAFSCATAAFLALRLRFFSTLLIYLPLVTICVPALAVFDTVDSRNLRKAWPTTRRVRFALSLAWCAHMLLMPKYPSSGRSAHMHPAAPLPALPGNGSATYFIAANLYDYGPHLPAWTRQIALLIEHLGRARVFVSVYESNSHDDTKARLRAFGDDLHRAGVRSRVVLDTDDRRRPGWQSNGHERVSYMADMRNKALEPLEEGLDGRRFDRLIFFNDVYFDWQSIIRLLATNDGAFDLACALDFDGIGLYDTWVIRDACGQRTKEIWPYFAHDPVAVDKLRAEQPVEVAACWNGVAAFDAAWFLPPPPASSSPYTPAASPPPGAPLRFRGDTACPASECFLIGYDMHLRSAPARPRIFVNPQVTVAYTAQNFLYYARLRHLALARPWRVVWEDWIAHGLFAWVSDHFWLKDGEQCPFEREGLVKAEYCPP
ncbi:cryptococcal mannosyltransferase 1-domain-containing protein [Mycena sp. CBHHK59/15]|nr:cryptococcal mannosyltransferase 1-domain-containing protein [Mycena sp. CBHHK59/15]